MYSSEWWSQEKGTFSVWRALNLYSSTTIRRSIEIFKKKISDPWGGINVCDNSWQGSSARMRRYNRPSRIIPSSLCWLQTKLCHRGAKRQKMWRCETFLGQQFRLLEEWLWIICRITVGVFSQQLKGFKSEACVALTPSSQQKTGKTHRDVWLFLLVVTLSALIKQRGHAIVVTFKETIFSLATVVFTHIGGGLDPSRWASVSLFFRNRSLWQGWYSLVPALMAQEFGEFANQYIRPKTEM